MWNFVVLYKCLLLIILSEITPLKGFQAVKVRESSCRTHTFLMVIEN